MPDTSSILRLVDEVLWSLRREGVRISTAEAIDCARALGVVGLEDGERVFEALACVVCQSKRERALAREVFRRFFSERKTLWDRLRARFSEDELEVLRGLLGEALLAFAGHGAELDRALASSAIERELAGMRGPLQAGFFAHRALERAGHREARAELATLRLALVDALGARGEELAEALARELEEGARLVREHVKARARRAPEPASALDRRAFAALDPREIEEVRRAVRSFAQRLRGRERVRKRRAERGPVDAHRALRSTLRTFGVPFTLPRRRRERDKPRLVLLCDISDSVRRAALFLLELVHAAHDLFERTRSFVFVSEIAESTRLFEERPPNEALPFVFGGGLVPVTANSSYGRALAAFAEIEIDPRTTVVILGDGRTNYAPDGLASLESVARRAGSVIWLCPEPLAEWGTGDSAMHRYAKVVHEALPVSCARELEVAARRLVDVR